MARKARKTVSPEERKARAEALHNTLSDQVHTLRSSDEWQRFLNYAQSFHAYSLNNVMLIMAQFPEASQVAGFRKWQEHGRQVRKGERSIKIFGYSTKKYTVKEDGEEVEKKRPFFPILSVFDISQTDLIDGATDATAVLGNRLEGDDAGRVFDRVRDYVVSLGWTVSREAIAGETNGYATADGSKRVVIREGVSEAQAAKTMIHEAAHITLGHTDDGSEYRQHRGLAEVEAESVAYVLGGLLGLDTSDYSIGYIAGWTGDDDKAVAASAKSVLQAVHTIADALTEEGSAPVKDEPALAAA